MNASARPARLDSTISPLNDVEEFRSLFCTRYESCLDLALRLGWKSWTCLGCELFDARRSPGTREHPEPDPQRDRESHETDRETEACVTHFPGDRRMFTHHGRRQPLPE